MIDWVIEEEGAKMISRDRCREKEGRQDRTEQAGAQHSDD